jgi:uncharacterized protein (DUF1330 family)
MLGTLCRSLVVVALLVTTVGYATTPREEPMNVHRLVHLEIADPEGYGRYRAGMEPLLAEHGGAFVLDVEGGSLHHHGAPFTPSRTLVLGFPSAEAAKAFATDPRYLAVREAHFERAVTNTHVTPL